MGTLQTKGQRFTTEALVVRACWSSAQKGWVNLQCTGSYDGPTHANLIVFVFPLTRLW